MYSILTTTQTPQLNHLRQFVVVAVTSTDVRVWTRVTNGGRGESNAWQDSSYNDFQNNSYGNELIVGELLSSPLSSVDVEAINNNERPTILFQKLTKQFGLRHKTIGTRTFDDVALEVTQLIAQSPNALSKYRSDGRINKNATIGATTTTTNVVVTPRPIATPNVVIQRVPSTEVTSSVIGENVSFIPSLESTKHYVPRKINGKTEEEFYDFCIANGINVMLEGGAGTGKTTSAKRYASLRGLPFYLLPCNAGVEMSQILGKYIPTENGDFVWQDGGLTQIFRHGGVAVLGEASSMSPKMTFGLHNALDDERSLTLLDHKGERVTAHPNTLIIADYNEGYRGTSLFNEAFKDRFGLKVKFDYDTEIERKFIPSKSLLELANKMRADSVSGIYETPISTRLLKNFVQVAQGLSFEFAVSNFINNFSSEERGSVKLLLEAYSHSIATELGCAVDEIVTEHEAV